MSSPQGWYDAGVPGRQRWWDGAHWTAHERVAPPVAPPITPSMGWYPAPGTADVRWWDGTTWTPFRIRDGKPKPDAFAIEPPSAGLIVGILFIVIALMQFGLALIARTPGFFATPVLFLAIAVIWIMGAHHSQAVRKLPAPQSAPIVDAVAQPLPGEVEGPDAGWYPMTAQTTRWWTGARWSWYVATRLGPRPGYAGPRGYLVSMIVGWFVAGLAVIGLLLVVAGSVIEQGPVTGFMIVIGIIFAVVFAGVAVFTLLLTRSRRNAMLLPTSPPPLR